MVIMNKLGIEKRAQIVRCLVDGNSIRGTVRITGAAKNTVAKLLCDLGAACESAHDSTVRSLRCKRVQCDEIWTFCHSKEKNVSPGNKGKLGHGDAWTWVAIDADTKLAVSYRVDHRDAEAAQEFMLDVAGRVLNKMQLTTDGHRAYLEAVENAFGIENVDYAQLVKMYGPESSSSGPEQRYSPGKVTGSKKVAHFGMPDKAHVSTSYIERQNLTMRMSMRRFTRLTNAFSKKIDNLMHAVSIHFFHYNFCRKHQTLKTSPAVAAGLTDHIWTIEEMIGLMD